MAPHFIQRVRRPFVADKQIYPDGYQGPENAENGKKTGDDSKPAPVGFWHPSLRAVRNRAFAKWIVTTAALMAFILAVLGLYWGVLFNVENRLKHLRIMIVDFDGSAPYDTTGTAPFVGPAITQLVQQTLDSGSPTLGWDIKPAEDFEGDPMKVRQAIYDWDAWAAIIINANASALLSSAVSTGNTSYDPLGACQVIYQDARDDTIWYDFVMPILSPLLTEATSMVGKEWTRMALQNTSSTAALTNLRAVPQALSPAIGFSMFNLRPFYPFTAIPSVSIGLIYLIIISFFSFSFYLPIHMQYLSPKHHPPLKFAQLVLWRWMATISAYFMLSLAYSFVSMAFQLNFTRTNPVTSETQVTMIEAGNPAAYGHGTFPIYWMLNFFGMIALGLACENAAMVVGMPWMGLFLIFWVISNVSTSFYEITIAPHFYKWGYAWPLHQVVEGSRQILFDLHSRIGINFGILIAWGVVNTALFPVCCWFQRWKKQKGWNEYWAQN